MQASQFALGQSQANPDFVAALVQASTAYSIVASQDIVDVRGLKLWAKGLPVSAVLQQRLLERQLRKPLESCLIAEDGVTPVFLNEALSKLLGSTTDPLSRALQPHAAQLERHQRQLVLHPVAQLLLTTLLATRAGAVEHAVQAMALAGAAALSQTTPMDTRLAMLGGLLHDIGEAYIQPEYVHGINPRSVVGYKHLAVHPRMGQLLLEGTTDYPPILCRAVGEHHERLNGAGYPARLVGDAISPLGMLLAAVETMLEHQHRSSAPLTSASFALRVVYGEYPERYSTIAFNWAREAKEPAPTDQQIPTGSLQQIHGTLLAVEQTAAELKNAALTPQGQELVAMAQRRVARLRSAWNSLGVWDIRAEQLTDADRFEMTCACTELDQRLFELARECLLLSEALPPSDRQTLAPLWAGLQLT